jgi:membrane protein DedA with SNARE-associated domain
MWSGLLVLGAEQTQKVPDPETTGDYIFLYGGLGIVALAILFFAIRSWRDRRAKRRF